MNREALIAKARAAIKPTDSIELVRAFEYLAAERTPKAYRDGYHAGKEVGLSATAAMGEIATLRQERDYWRKRYEALAVFEHAIREAHAALAPTDEAQRKPNDDKGLASTPTDDEREAQGWREAEAYADDHEPSKRAETADDFMAGWRAADRTRRTVQGEPTDSGKTADSSGI